MRITFHMLIGFFALSIVWVSLPGWASADGIKIITNTSIPAGSVDAEMVKKIYSGHMTKWADNETIVLAVVEDAAVHQILLKDYVGKSESQFKTTWKKMMFTGKGSYPKQFDSEASLIDFVSKTKGAIGYVDGGTEAQGVNVVQ